jgi:SAM-dependent methyltransferase
MPITRDYSLEEEIYIFDSDLDSSQSVYDSRYLKDLEELESKHFWFQTRKDKICGFFEKNIKKESRILELGGGTGFIAQQLRILGFHVELADIHLNGLKYAQEKGIQKLYQFDLNNPPFKEEFDVICLFDVLEHQNDDKRAMECLKHMLKPQGKIILTVPAHRWLWNRDDRLNGHFRRYVKQDIVDLCRSCNMKPKHVEYFFAFIVPFLFARSILNRDTGKEVKKGEEIQLGISPVLNRLCFALTRLEFLCARWLPNVAGGSLLLMAEKQ